MPEFFDNLPRSIEAEQSVLGALLLDPKLVGEAERGITSEAFFEVTHQKIYSILLAMSLKGLPIDFVSVYNQVVSEKVFDDETDAKNYLATLQSFVPTTKNLGTYLGIVSEKYKLRRLVEACRTIITDVSEGSGEAADILDKAEQLIYDIRGGAETTDLRHIKDVLFEELDHLEKLRSGDDTPGISTGYSALDNVLLGLSPTDFVLLAARPAFGKTTLGMNIAQNVAKIGKKVAVFSLEMSSIQIVERMLASESEVGNDKFRRGDFNDSEWAKINNSMGKLSNISMFFDDGTNITVGEIKAKCRRIKDLSLIVIDYLQLMTHGSGKFSESRTNEVSAITRGLKIMAKELGVPVLCLSQLSRNPESRTDHRPVLADLRESGSIEQDADIVMMIYRDDKYNPDTEDVGKTEIIIAKNRHGETKTEHLKFIGKYTKFVGYDYAHANDVPPAGY